MNRAEKKELKWIMKNELQTRRFKRRPDWKGYEVYAPVCKKYCRVGLPLCVLVKDGQVRLTTPEESLEYLDYQTTQKGEQRKTIEIYLDYQDRWSELFCNKDFEGYKKLVAKGIEFRNNNFTKSDWEQLIAQSTGRAKYEYTRMMNERFNEDGTPKIKKSTYIHDGKISD